MPGRDDIEALIDSRARVPSTKRDKVNEQTPVQPVVRVVFDHNSTSATKSTIAGPSRPRSVAHDFGVIGDAQGSRDESSVTTKVVTVEEADFEEGHQEYISSRRPDKLPRRISPSWS